MKRRFTALALTLCLAFTIILPASAVTSPTPEELYEEYLRIADEVNAQYGTDVSIVPLEDMDPNNMPTLEEVYEDVSTLASFFANATTNSTPPSNLASTQASRGIGNHPVSTTITKYYATTALKFLASTTVVVNHDGSEYYLDRVFGTSVSNTYAPTGFAVDATSNSNWILSSSEKSGVITRSYKVTYGSAFKNYTVTASVVLSTSTGSVTISPA